MQGPEGLTLGLSVVDHCLTVCAVARLLLSRMPPRLLGSIFPVGVELVAGLHDIGKVSPGFQAKIFKACGLDAGLGYEPDDDRIAGFHSAVGAATLAGKGPFLAEIIGRHHGESPASLARADAEIYGGPAWQSEREKLITFLTAQNLVKIPTISSPSMADAISGLVSVSDWIGSGELLSSSRGDNHSDIERALDDSGFVEPAIRQSMSFSDVFE